ncbi:porin [Janthinobacterium sp. Mn2066]|uniref:porin n=1 Tax=Janthinobacterium sp. Mn2066 TaxID=3395264 RepID=UPI003BD5ADB4
MHITQRSALRAATALACLAFGQQACAQSNLSFTGVIDTYAGSLQRSGEAARTNVVNSSGMTTSWWGFKGVEDLGGGLQAQFNLTGFFRPDNGGAGRYDSDTLFARDANVGLAGGFGRISIGRDLAPNFVPSIVLNPFGGSFAFAPLLVHTQASAGAYPGQKWAPTTAGDTGWSNEIMYVTPNLNGLTASLFYQFGEQAGNTGKNNAGANAMYSHGPLTLGAYVQRIAVNNPLDAVTGDSKVFSFTPYNVATGAVYKLAAARRQTTWFVGGAYDFKLLKLFGTWQTADNSLPDGLDRDQHSLKSDTAQLGASAPLGSGVAMLSWGRTAIRAGGDFGGPGWRSSVRRNTVSLGYDYLLSKRTDVYSVVMRDKISDQDGGTSVGAGIRHKF